MIDLRVMVRAGNGHVVVAAIAAPRMADIAGAVADALPPSLRYVSNDERSAYIAAKLVRLMDLNIMDRDIAHAIAALALYYAELHYDDPWWHINFRTRLNHVRQAGASYIRAKILDMIEAGRVPMLALGVVGKSVVLSLSSDHARCADQLGFLVERLTEGDANFVEDR